MGEIEPVGPDSEKNQIWSIMREFHSNGTGEKGRLSEQALSDMVGKYDLVLGTNSNKADVRKLLKTLIADAQKLNEMLS
jgi:hypothetical protein